MLMLNILLFIVFLSVGSYVYHSYLPAQDLVENTIKQCINQKVPRSEYIGFVLPGKLITGSFSILQLIVVVPLIAILRRNRQNREKIKGVILGAIITAFLTGSCFLQASLSVMKCLEN
jgi:phosphotransferase system  glucose/maltose/N-acetylglucosamine-specific IIC component